MSQFGPLAAVAAFGGLALLSWRQKVFAATQTPKEYEVRAFLPWCAFRGGSTLCQAWLRKCPVLASGSQSLLTSIADQHVDDAGRLVPSPARPTQTVV